MSAVIRGEVLSSTYDSPSVVIRDTHADAHAWAAHIRAQMGEGGCGDSAHAVDTPFRRNQKWAPVDECKLRAEARRQLAEAVSRRPLSTPPQDPLPLEDS